MKLDKKYVIGTHVMFYEIDMISEFVRSICNSVEDIENKDNITIDLFFNMSELELMLHTKYIKVMNYIQLEVIEEI